MSPSTHSGNKRKSIAAHAMHLAKSREIIDFSNNNKQTQASVNREGYSNSDTDDDDNDGKTRASVASSR